MRLCLNPGFTVRTRRWELSLHVKDVHTALCKTQGAAHKKKLVNQSLKLFFYRSRPSTSTTLQERFGLPKEAFGLKGAGQDVRCGRARVLEFPGAEQK